MEWDHDIGNGQRPFDPQPSFEDRPIPFPEERIGPSKGFLVAHVSHVDKGARPLGIVDSSRHFPDLVTDPEDRFRRRVVAELGTMQLQQEPLWTLAEGDEFGFR